MLFAIGAPTLGAGAQVAGPGKDLIHFKGGVFSVRAQAPTRSRQSVCTALISAAAFLVPVLSESSIFLASPVTKVRSRDNSDLQCVPSPGCIVLDPPLLCAFEVTAQSLMGDTTSRGARCSLWDFSFLTEPPASTHWVGAEGEGTLPTASACSPVLGSPSLS